MKTYTRNTLKCVMLAAVIISYTVNAQTLEVVKEINTTGAGSSSYPSDFTVANNKLFFIAGDNSGTHGLWVTTGTEASTQMLTPVSASFFAIQDIVAYNNKIYFAYNDDVNGNELWVSDGTVAGTNLLKDLYPGSTGSFPEAFTVANGKLLFMASNVDGARRLYASDGTPAGTTVIKNTSVGLLNGMTDFAVLNSDMYFNSDNGTGVGTGLWKTDGTLTGTVLVKPDINPGVFPGNYAVLDNKIYFSCDDGTSGSELWVSDGTAVGTHMVINLRADGGGVFFSGAPQNLMVYNSKIYFTASDDTHGAELFVTDGTAAGTQMVKDIVPGAVGSVPNKAVLFNGLLYFTCAGSQDLWKSDGTEPNTQLVKTGLNAPIIAAVWNGKIYIILGNGANNAVWQSDGSTAGTIPISLLNTTNPVLSLYNTDNKFLFEEYNGALYLCANNVPVTVGFEPAKIMSGVLPLHLISFAGVTNQETDVLTWTTENEINMAHFIIQQSINGVAFSFAAKVQATGNSVYKYTQSAALNTGGFYRLQMVDINGQFTYSPIIKLKHKISSALSARYNMTTKQIIVRNNTLHNCDWKLFTVNGSLIKQGTSNNVIININAADIAAGTYIVVCKTSEATTAERMVIF